MGGDAGDTELMREVTNFVSDVAAGTPSQVEYLVTCNCVDSILNALSQRDNVDIDEAVLLNLVDTLEKMLKSGNLSRGEHKEGKNPVAEIIESRASFLRDLETLQGASSDDVARKAASLL